MPLRRVALIQSGDRQVDVTSRDNEKKLAG